MLAAIGIIIGWMIGVYIAMRAVDVGLHPGQHPLVRVLAAVTFLVALLGMAALFVVGVGDYGPGPGLMRNAPYHT